ncbi:hypothetical protein Bbelb_328990 [Branchiostoma belcheri]|nr:hypothetical protein Bbelb_328990 [Branchiostoma belcheri]
MTEATFQKSNGAKVGSLVVEYVGKLDSVERTETSSCSSEDRDVLMEGGCVGIEFHIFPPVTYSVGIEFHIFPPVTYSVGISSFTFSRQNTRRGADLGERTKANKADTQARSDLRALMQGGKVAQTSGSSQIVTGCCADAVAGDLRRYAGR